MDTASLPAYLRALKDAAAGGAAPAANAMAGAFQDRVVSVTLRQTVHPPGLFWKAMAGRPPAYASGELARSVRMTPAKGSVLATAYVGAYARYAAMQEFGGFARARTSAYMHWVNSRGSWWMKQVYVPAHPYFEPTVVQMIQDGSLSRAAADAFYREIRGFFTA